MCRSKAEPHGCAPAEDRSALTPTPPTGHGRARGLVSGRKSGRRIDAQTFAPPADLADVVQCFWVGRWDLPEGAPHDTELLSDPCLHMAFETPGGPHAGARLVGVSLAALLGYTDQAHLAHDFKAATGKSPSEFSASLD